jgi:transcriptional regulator with XRE-family HTH domain
MGHPFDIKRYATGRARSVTVATAEQRRRFGRALQRARHECGLSQAQLARTLGVSQASVSQWLLGQTSPRPDRVGELERVLRVEPDSLARLLGLTVEDGQSMAGGVSVMEAAEADPRLGDRERQILAAVYRELVRQRGQAGDLGVSTAAE